MAFFTLVGVCLHALHHLLRPHDPPAAKNGFASALCSLIFTINWLGIHANSTGVHIFSAGIVAGACAGYELYASLNEVLNLISGLIRRDMILHHGLCLVFIVLTGCLWQQLPLADDIYWAMVWDSIAISLASNVPLNLRAMCKGTPYEKASNVVFALTFMSVRVFEQLQFARIAAAESGPIGIWLATGKLPFVSHTTTMIFAAWVVLMLLNLFWSFKVMSMSLKSIMGKDKKCKSKEEKSE